MAAHQLQAPLTVMNWNLDNILAGKFGRLTPPAQQAVQKVYEANQEITHLVIDLLTVARLEGGRLQLKVRPTDFVALVRQGMARYNQAIREHHGEMYFTAPREPLPNLSIDPVLISQVIDNIISNAIKYNPVKTHITIVMTKAKDQVTVAIKNSGPAIPPDKQSSLFQKFARAETKDTEKTSGTGLGLYITKQIMELHHGTINFTSAKNEGTTFFISLPL